MVQAQLLDVQRQMKRSSGPTFRPPGGHGPTHSAAIVQVFPSCSHAPEGSAALVMCVFIEPHIELAMAFGPQCGVQSPASVGALRSYENWLPFGHRGPSLHASTKYGGGGGPPSADSESTPASSARDWTSKEARQETSSVNAKVAVEIQSEIVRPWRTPITKP
jgi:hypothetical protein